MKAVVIGTRAYRDEGWNDTDILCDEEFRAYLQPKLGKCPLGSSGTDSGKPVELIVAAPGSAYELALDYPASCKTIFVAGEEIPCAQLKLIAALKKAHLVTDKRWYHHIREYSYLKKLLDTPHVKPSQWDDKLRAIFKLHRVEVAKKKHPKLNQSKQDFFGQKESYNIFDHDSIHVAVAHPRPPAYLSYKGDAEVWCEKSKWDAISHAEKIRGVVEEACVLALERSIIPALFQDEKAERQIAFVGEKRAFEMAVMKVSTTITSGWFREFAIENHDEVMANKPDYTKAFFEGIGLGIVKKFEKASY